MIKYELTKDEKRMLNKSFYYAMGVNFASSSLVGQAKSYAMAMLPALNAYYMDEKRKGKAFARHTKEYFNTHSVFMGLLVGIGLAMEKKNGQLDEEDNIDSTISNVKASLMGPTAGIGDSFFYNCWRVIVAGISLGFCAEGSLMGPLFFLLFYGVGTLIIKYFLLRVGYISGSTVISEMFEKGIIPAITKAASAVGAIMIGAMVATNVKINFTFAPEFNGAVFDMQGMLDKIAPGFLSLVLWYVIMKRVKKGDSPAKLIYMIMLVCIVLAFFKLF